MNSNSNNRLHSKGIMYTVSREESVSITKIGWYVYGHGGKSNSDSDSDSDSDSLLVYMT